MKRYKVEVSLISEYEIIIDDEDMGEEFLNGYKESFNNIDTWQEHAEYIAERRAKGDEFIEGYGIPLVNGKNPRWDEDERSLEKSIDIRVIYENEAEVNSTEIKN